MTRRRWLGAGGVVALAIAVSVPTWWFASTSSSSVPLPPAVTITPAKTAVVAGEPLPVKVEMSNPGAESTTVNVHPSVGFQGLAFSIAQGGAPFRPYAPPSVRAGGLTDLEVSPVTLAPGQKIERTVTLFFNLLAQDFPFPAAGAFSVKATLYTTPGNAATGVDSNTAAITVSAPAGASASAFASLRARELGPLLTAAAVYVLDARFKAADMKQFLADFPATPYTPFVQEAFDATCQAFPRFCTGIVPAGAVVGHVANALTGAAIDHAAVSLLRPASASSPICSDPAVVASTSTNPSGDFRLDNIPVGTYDVSVSVPGYATACQAGIVVAEGAATAVTFNASPTLGPGQLRIVLTWGANPADLDAHLWMPPGFPYHLYKGRPGSLFGCPFSQLEHDVATGFGPEVVTIGQAFPGTFVYAVNRSSGIGALAGSGAEVQVYSAAGLIATVRVPATGTGDWWYVFDFSSSSGVTAKNLLQPTSPAPYPDTDALCGGGVT